MEKRSPQYQPTNTRPETDPVGIVSGAVSRVIGFIDHPAQAIKRMTITP